jgi:hypothetical protein
MIFAGGTMRSSCHEWPLPAFFVIGSSRCGPNILQPLIFQWLSVISALLKLGYEAVLNQPLHPESVNKREKTNIYHFFINSHWTNVTAIAVLDADTV